jgi:maleate cis-trans isomerase
MKQIGIICLPTDCSGPYELYNITRDIPNLIIKSTNCYFPKNIQDLNKNTYKYALTHLSKTAECLRPVGVFNCIGLACTSFSFSVGYENIKKKITDIHPETIVIDMNQSLLKAVHTLSIKRVIVLTAYTEELNSIFRSNIESDNILIYIIFQKN